MIYGFEFSINTGTASSKPFLGPKTETVFISSLAYILRSSFLKLILERVQITIKKNIYNIFFKHDENYKHSPFFKLKTIRGNSFLIKNLPFSLKYMVLRFCTYHDFLSLSCFYKKIWLLEQSLGKSNILS